MVFWNAPVPPSSQWQLDQQFLSAQVKSALPARGSALKGLAKKVAPSWRIQKDSLYRRGIKTEKANN